MAGRTGFKRGAKSEGTRGVAKKRAASDDGDTAPRPQKMTKGADAEDDDGEDSGPFVPTLKKDDNGDDYVPLKSNDLRRVTISEFKGKTMVNIREHYTTDAGKTLPGKKGISLTLDQYNAFLTALPLIETALEKKGVKVVKLDFAEPDADAAPVDDAREEDQAGDEDDGEDDQTPLI